MPAKVEHTIFPAVSKVVRNVRAPHMLVQVPAVVRLVRLDILQIPRLVRLHHHSAQSVLRPVNMLEQKILPPCPHVPPEHIKLHIRLAMAAHPAVRPAQGRPIPVPVRVLVRAVRPGILQILHLIRHLRRSVRSVFQVVNISERQIRRQCPPVLREHTRQRIP